ncbi:androgen-induced gene 1 protein-like [Branchiostoma floridae x Branchiostoma japonicum]
MLSWMSQEVEQVHVPTYQGNMAPGAVWAGVTAAHLAMFAILCHNVAFHLSVQGYTPYDSIGGRWKYLDQLNLDLVCTFFGGWVLCDVTQPLVGAPAKAGLIAFLDFILAAFAFPTTLLTVVTEAALWYGGMLVPSLRQQTPPVPDDARRWHDPHVSRTVVLMFLLLHMYMVEPRYSSRRRGLAGTVALTAVYMAWVSYLASSQQVWVYPFMEGLSGLQRLLAIPVCIVLSVVAYYCGEYLASKLWSPLSKNVD